MRRKASVLSRLRAMVARSRHPRTRWDYVLVDEADREVETLNRKWTAILRREELARKGHAVRILCIGYGRVYRLTFPYGPLSPQFILVEKGGNPS